MCQSPRNAFVITHHGPNINRPSHFYIVTAFLVRNSPFPLVCTILSFHLLNSTELQPSIILFFSISPTCNSLLLQQGRTEEQQHTTPPSTILHYPLPPPPSCHWGDTGFHLTPVVTERYMGQS